MAGSRKRRSRSCPKGMIRRVAYSKKPYSRKGYTRKDGTRVRASRVGMSRVGSSCVPDKGKPGKTPSSKKIPAKVGKPGLMRSVGYKLSSADSSRHKAIAKAVEKDSAKGVLRHLNLIRNLTPSDEVKNKRTLSKDVAYISRTYKTNKSRSKAGSKKKSKKRSRSRSRKW